MLTSTVSPELSTIKTDVLQAFIVQRTTNTSFYTAITDKYGKLVISCPYLASNMSHIKRGIFIRGQITTEPQKNGSVFFNNTLITACVSPWTYQYIHCVHFIYFICMEYVKIGFPINELWNLITTLSWDISPDAEHMYLLILQVFFHIGCLEETKDYYFIASHESSWHTLSIELPPAKEIQSLWRILVSRLQLTAAAKHKAERLIYDITTIELVPKNLNKVKIVSVF